MSLTLSPGTKRKSLKIHVLTIRESFKKSLTGAMLCCHEDLNLNSSTQSKKERKKRALKIKYSTTKKLIRADEMAHWVSTLAAILDNRNMIPGKDFHSRPLVSTYTTVTCVCIHNK